MTAEEYLKTHPFVLGETGDGKDFLSTDDDSFMKELAPIMESYAALNVAELQVELAEEKKSNKLLHRLMVTAEKRGRDKALAEVAEAKAEPEEVSYDPYKCGLSEKYLGEVGGEVAEATKEMYPKEFVEWIIRQVDLCRITRCKEGYQFVNLDEEDDSQLFKRIISDINELFEYWKQNIRK